MAGAPGPDLPDPVRSRPNCGGGGRTCMRDGFTTLHGHPDGTDYATLRRIYAKP